MTTQDFKLMDMEQQLSHALSRRDRARAAELQRQIERYKDQKRVTNAKQ